MPRYIDVEWLMEKVREREYPLDDDPLTTSYGLSTLGIFRILEEAPTISPDEVRGAGEWEKDSDGLDVCSECGEVALQRVFIKLPDKIVDLQMVRSKFCPSCGARMGGVQDALS